MKKIVTWSVTHREGHAACPPPAYRIPQYASCSPLQHNVRKLVSKVSTNDRFVCHIIVVIYCSQCFQNTRCVGYWNLSVFKLFNYLVVGSAIFINLIKNYNGMWWIQPCTVNSQKDKNAEKGYWYSGINKQLWWSGKDFPTGIDPAGTAKKSATADAENAMSGT